jgi:quercetin dioxygenase-like cupin family protein
MSNITTHRIAGSGWKRKIIGDVFTFLINGDETGGQYCTMEVVVAPRNGPDPHSHDKEEESFYVLEGEYDFKVGDQTFRARQGDFIHIPRDTVHEFKNALDTRGRLLATFTPAGIERFFMENGEPVDD